MLTAKRVVVSVSWKRGDQEQDLGEVVYQSSEPVPFTDIDQALDPLMPAGQEEQPGGPHTPPPHRQEPEAPPPPSGRTVPTQSPRTVRGTAGRG